MSSSLMMLCPVRDATGREQLAACHLAVQMHAYSDADDSQRAKVLGRLRASDLV
ncbi:MAG: hypothetical protein MI861_20555 [Pirellulales bacterium]|nr:hypothetical protein [Pirellulales bacterium]